MALEEDILNHFFFVKKFKTGHPLWTNLIGCSQRAVTILCIRWSNAKKVQQRIKNELNKKYICF